MKICLIKTGALGGVVRSTSIVPALRKAYAQCHVSWVAGKTSIEIIKRARGVDSCFDITYSGAAKSIDFDWVISLDERLECCQFASCLTSKKLTGAYAEKGGRHIRYTDDVAEWFSIGALRPVEIGGIAVSRWLKSANSRTYGETMYRCLGLPTPVHPPTVIPNCHDFSQIRTVLDAHGVVSNTVLIGVNVGAGGLWEQKQMGHAALFEIISIMLRTINCKIILLGGESEAAKISLLTSSLNSPDVFAYEGSQIGNFIAMISRCDVVLTADSFAMHVAISVGSRVVAFFGPTSPAEIDFHGRGEFLRTMRSCHPCYMEKCVIRPNCVDTIPAMEVVRAVERQLSLA